MESKCIKKLKTVSWIQSKAGKYLEIAYKVPPPQFFVCYIIIQIGRNNTRHGVINCKVQIYNHTQR